MEDRGAPREGNAKMEAYWFAQKDGEITVGKVDRSPYDHKDYRLLPDEQPFPDFMSDYFATEAWVRAKTKIPTPWMLANGYCVSNEVKAVIQALEPSMHQFVPITVKCGTKEHHSTRSYFTLRINQRVDDVNVEESDVRWETNEFNGKILRSWLKKDAPLVLPLKSIEGKHLWLNKSWAGGFTLMSGDLYNLLREAGHSTGLRFQKQIVE